jgi:16S rRNA (guanine966-N2)-methyltransferase
MRITSGEFRGRLLDTPKDNAIRPTSDKIRHAIFNAILSRIDIDGITVIDACSGTGALGIESLSHGAKCVIFIDNNPSHLNLAKINVTKFDAQNKCHFLKSDVTKVPVKPDHIDVASLLFLDPPYRQDIILPALQSLKTNGWIDDETLCVIESEVELSPSYICEFDRSYGDTRITMCYGKDIPP